MESYNGRQILDLSSFFLVEFSDDSEADLDSSVASALVEVDQEDNDDAQSCCNDFSSCGSGPEDDETDTTHPSGYEFQDSVTVEQPWEEDNEDEEEGVVNMSVRGRGSDLKTFIQGRGRYHQQPMNETERNKIFWETCLASGY